jgi:hypothetical protein
VKKGSQESAGEKTLNIAHKEETLQIIQSVDYMKMTTERKILKTTGQATKKKRYARNRKKSQN